MANRLILGAAAAIFAAAALLFGGVFRSSTPAAASGDFLPEAVAAELAKGFAAGDTQAEILGLQGELKLIPARRLDLMHEPDSMPEVGDCLEVCRKLRGATTRFQPKLDRLLVLACFCEVVGKQFRLHLSYFGRKLLQDIRALCMQLLPPGDH